MKQLFIFIVFTIPWFSYFNRIKKHFQLSGKELLHWLLLMFLFTHRSLPFLPFYPPNSPLPYRFTLTQPHVSPSAIPIQISFENYAHFCVGKVGGLAASDPIYDGRASSLCHGSRAVELFQASTLPRIMLSFVRLLPDIMIKSVITRSPLWTFVELSPCFKLGLKI